MQKIEYMEDFYNRPINIGELRALGEEGWTLCDKEIEGGQYTYLFSKPVRRCMADLCRNKAKGSGMFCEQDGCRGY